MASSPQRTDRGGRRRRGAMWLAACGALTLGAGCVGGDADTPEEGEGTDVNADMGGDDGSTSGDVSDSNSGANGEGPGPDSDAGDDGQTSPPAPGSN